MIYRHTNSGRFANFAYWQGRGNFVTKVIIASENKSEIVGFDWDYILFRILTLFHIVSGSYYLMI